MRTDLQMPILVVEDEPDIRRFVGAALMDQGWPVSEAGSLREAVDILGNTRLALAVVDLGLPDGDGVALIRDLRQWSHMPVLVLSARTAESEKVLALDAGADDYLSKPFGVQELLARVRALLRRQPPADEDAIVRFGQVEVDRVHRAVRRNGEAVHLTPIEYRLLAVFLANPGRVMTHRQLLREVWGPGHTERGHYLRIYVGHLRQKLEADPTQPMHLLTEVGVGYRFQFQDFP